MVGTSGGGSASGGISRTCPKRSCRRASDSPRVPCEAPSRCCCAASLPLSRLEGTARLHAAAHSGRSRVAPRARWSADTRSQRSSRCRQSQQKTARQGPLWGLPSLGLPSRPTRRRRHARLAQARFHGTPHLADLEPTCAAPSRQHLLDASGTEATSSGNAGSAGWYKLPRPAGVTVGLGCVWAILIPYSKSIDTSLKREKIQHVQERGRGKKANHQERRRQERVFSSS